MKKLIVLLAVLSVLGAPTLISAAPPNAPLCGRVVRRIAPAEPRGFYGYDVLVGRQIVRWGSLAKLGVGARICV